jgi:AcrR family transcriptional regulator
MPTSKSARTRQRLLDAGARLFSEHGYRNTRLSDIADAAGIQTGSIYYHFASREELVAEILRLGMENAWSHVREAVDALAPDATPIDRLGVAIRAHVAVVLDISDYASAHSRIVGEVPDEVRREHFEHQRAYGAYWNELFEAARDAGELDPGIDLFVARMLVFGAMNTAGEWYATSKRSSAEIADAAAAMFVRGLRAPSAGTP